MKYLFFIFFLIVIDLEVHAQYKRRVVPNLVYSDQKRIHFGFLVSINTMDFTIHNSGASTNENNHTPLFADVDELKLGLGLGVVANIRLNKIFDLRLLPNVSFGQRNVSYVDGDKNIKDKPLSIKSTFIEMPILIKYSSERIDNYKPYLIMGVNPRCDLMKNNGCGLLLNKIDLYYELGFGVDSYLNYFKFTTEFRISIGIFNMLNSRGTGNKKELPYTQAIDKLTSNIFTLTFYFE